MLGLHLQVVAVSQPPPRSRCAPPPRSARGRAATRRGTHALRAHRQRHASRCGTRHSCSPGRRRGFAHVRRLVTVDALLGSGRRVDRADVTMDRVTARAVGARRIPVDATGVVVQVTQRARVRVLRIAAQIRIVASGKRLGRMAAGIDTPRAVRVEVGGVLSAVDVAEHCTVVTASAVMSKLPLRYCVPPAMVSSPRGSRHTHRSGSCGQPGSPRGSQGSPHWPACSPLMHRGRQTSGRASGGIRSTPTPPAGPGCCRDNSYSRRRRAAKHREDRPLRSHRPAKVACPRDSRCRPHRHTTRCSRTAGPSRVRPRRCLVHGCSPRCGTPRSPCPTCRARRPRTRDSPCTVKASVLPGTSGNADVALMCSGLHLEVVAGVAGQPTGVGYPCFDASGVCIASVPR